MLFCIFNLKLYLSKFFFLICVFYWSIVDLQCFRCTAGWFNYTYTHILFFRLLSIIGHYKVLAVVLCLPISYLSKFTPKCSKGALKITPSPQNTFLNWLYTHILLMNVQWALVSKTLLLEISPWLTPDFSETWSTCLQVQDTCLEHSISNSLLCQVPLVICLPIFP